MIFRKDAEYALLIKKKKGMKVESRSTKYSLRKLHIGNIVTAQHELNTEDGYYCFFIDKIATYVYCTDENVDIFEKIN